MILTHFITRGSSMRRLLNQMRSKDNNFFTTPKIPEITAQSRQADSLSAQFYIMLPRVNSSFFACPRRHLILALHDRNCHLDRLVMFPSRLTDHPSR